MKICKCLNNNVAVIKDHGKEKIVMGRGIAFSKHPGDEIDPSKVNKVFVADSSESLDPYKQLFAEIPYEFLELTEKIVDYAKTILGKKLDQKIYLDLSDHMYASVQRAKEGIVVSNALLWDIQRFYSDEYSIGLFALSALNKQFSVELPKDEAGFIALHFVNAELSEGDVEHVYQITKIMQEVMNIIKYHFRVEFDEESVYYYRFISHLRLFAQRLVNGRFYDDHSDDDLFALVIQKYPQAYECVGKIVHYCKESYHHQLSNEEQMYLTIHIERLIFKS